MEPVTPPWKRPKVATSASAMLEWMRIEHRQTENEHRLLIFRPSVPGVVAKIIWTSRGTSAAEIEDLHVKGSFRGFDLGGLLFQQALQLLKSAHIIHCELEAEEDSRRHNRLLGFYQSLGCSIKDNVKMLYLNNNDGETYRKIPMKIDTSTVTGGYEMIGRTFCPVLLLQNNGQPVHVQQNSYHWLLTVIHENIIQFITTRGHYLVVDENGDCLVKDNQSKSPSPTSFRLLQHESSCLWQIQVVQMDGMKSLLFLEISNHGELKCAHSPRHFWKLFQSNSFMFSHETPCELRHIEMFEQIQTIEYVHRMRQNYCSFQRHRMSLKHALDSLGKRFYQDVSFRTRSFRAAELCRAYGHPDWVQLVALMFFLGPTALIDESKKNPVTSTPPSINKVAEDFDWTIPVRSKVVGSDGQITESKSEPANSVPSRCSLDNILLAWTGPEYMYHMVIHNEIAIPYEGLVLLQLAALVDWHTSSPSFMKSYKTSTPSPMKHAKRQHWDGKLENEIDIELRTAVEEFATVLQLSQDPPGNYPLAELSTKEFEELWETHYAAIAAKYGAGDVLRW